MQKFPRLDIAVTTPGLNIRKTILDYTEEDLDRVINLNIKGTVWFFQSLRPHHGRPEERQPDRLFLGARRHDRAWAGASTVRPRRRSVCW